jgi:phosphohistidine phosphatase
MNLYLMRHANAGLARENPLLDAKRSLIKEGKEQCMLMARMLSALKVQVDVIVSSPLKRALQTAQFVGTELGYDAKVEISRRSGPTPISPISGDAGQVCRLRGRAGRGPQPNRLPVSGPADHRQRRRGHPHEKRLRGARRSGPPSAAAAVAHRSALGRAIYASVQKSSRPKTSRK